ncbi:MAG: preprotein translocase subunit SecE [Patescibacteria group bacterium]|nr:preprotein translocase subunit SecE [Patescibacteria group bacterium]
MKSLIQYIKQSINELHKVTFPTKKESVHSSVVVLIFTGLMALAIALVDAVFDIGVVGLSELIGTSGNYEDIISQMEVAEMTTSGAEVTATTESGVTLENVSIVTE